MHLLRKLLPLGLAAALIVIAVAACTSLAAETTPGEIRAVPASQSLLLESAIQSITENDPQWVDIETGNVHRDAILKVLNADKNAWDQLDRFYNPDAAPAAPAE